MKVLNYIVCTIFLLDITDIYNTIAYHTTNSLQCPVADNYMIVQVGGLVSVDKGFSLAHFLVDIKPTIGSTFSGEMFLIQVLIGSHPTEICYWFPKLMMHENYFRVYKNKGHWVACLELHSVGLKWRILICIFSKFPRSTDTNYSRDQTLKPKTLNLWMWFEIAWLKSPKNISTFREQKIAIY